MRVYELAPDTQRYTVLAAARESDINALSDFDGTPVGKRWRPITVEPVFGEFPELRRVGDLTDLGAVPVFSARAVEVLNHELRSNGELLRVEAPSLEFPYFVYNVTTVIDALDRTTTVAEWLDQNRLLAVQRYGFRGAPLTGVTIFKIPELRYSTVFVTQPFVDRVHQAQLEGFDLRMVWAG